jgi:pyruvate-ferredoxin/flavodoxin oxidoreductase
VELDSKPPSVPLKSYAYNETRYSMLAHNDPQTAARLLALAEADVAARWRLYEHLASMPGGAGVTP